MGQAEKEGAKLVEAIPETEPLTCLRKEGKTLSCEGREPWALSATNLGDKSRNVPRRHRWDEQWWCDSKIGKTGCGTRAPGEELTSISVWCHIVQLLVTQPLGLSHAPRDAPNCQTNNGGRLWQPAAANGWRQWTEVAQQQGSWDTNLNLDVIKKHSGQSSADIYFIYMENGRIHYKEKIYPITINP